MKILIVEDDLKISSFLKKGLEEENYNIDCSYDGSDALYLIQTNIYDLILLDIMIPTVDGINLCKVLRKDGVSTPIIMLTAKSTIGDKVIGLNEGANDYLTKPFSFDELLARINVQLRTGKSLSNTIQIADLKIEIDKKLVTREGKNIVLTSKEYILLEYLMLNKEKLLTEEMINNALWDMDDTTASNILTVYLYRLRNKIDKHFDKKLIHTIRGMGYKMSEKI
jgi:two-component system copper resistance phosphate regulon response regulator CusR